MCECCGGDCKLSDVIPEDDMYSLKCFQCGKDFKLTYHAKRCNECFYNNHGKKEKQNARDLIKNLLDQNDDYVSIGAVRSYPSKISFVPYDSSIKIEASVKPEEPITLKCEEGYETYAFDKSTIGVRPKWVSVKERLPEKDQDVLIFCEGTYKPIDVSRRCEADFSSRLGWGGRLDSDVNHWMPLPKPPSNNES